MNQIHKADDYDFTQASKSGKVGLELLKNEANGRFYFHFNDAKGAPFLFSQAYTREMTCEKGWQSVMKNIVSDEYIETQMTEGGVCFVVRATNRQEIARSKVFKSLIELESKLTFLRKNLKINDEKTSPKPVVEAQLGVSTMTVSDSKEVENEALKKTISMLESQLSDLKKQHSDAENLSDETLRHVFRLEFYKNSSPERLYGKITHPFSSQTQTFLGFDETKILGFMTQVMHNDLPQNTPIAPPQYMPEKTPNKGAMAQATDAVKPNFSAATAPLRVVNMVNQSNVLHQNQPFALTLELGHNKQMSHSNDSLFQVDIAAFDINAREHINLLSKQEKVLLNPKSHELSLTVEPLILKEGSYRLSFLATEKPQTEAQTQWQGSLIVQIEA